ncbi:MAG: PorV/PorQ family protein [Candidatus Latescibacterota bacterium]|nr:PorV/PorQ family protein [Candidatus Latescibacterota bacterium]
MYCIFALFILGLPIFINAQTGFTGLQMSRGARPAAMADIGTAMISPETSNPAAIPIGSGRDYIFSHTSWIQEIEQENIHLIYKRPSQSWGFHAHSWRSEDLDYRIGPSEDPLGTFGLYEFTFGLSHVRTIQNKVRGGTRVSFLRQGIYDSNAKGWTLDLGILQFLRPNLHWGISLLNFGRVTHLDRVSTPLPTQLQIGLFNQQSANFQTILELHKMDGSATTLHWGSAYRLNKKITLRCGYQNLKNRMLSLGTSLMINSWYFDYSYQPFGDNLGQVHRVNLRLTRSQ